MSALRRTLERLGNRIRMVVARVEVLLTDDSTPIQTAQAGVLDSETRELENYQQFGFQSRPMPGCDGVAVFVAGNRDDGIIVATQDGRFRKTDLEPGETVIHDAFGQTIELRADGTVKILAAQKVEIDGPIEVKITSAARVEVDAGVELALESTALVRIAAPLLALETLDVSAGSGGIFDPGGTVRRLIDERLIAAFNNHRHFASGNLTTGVNGPDQIRPEGQSPNPVTTDKFKAN